MAKEIESVPLMDLPETEDPSGKYSLASGDDGDYRIAVDKLRGPVGRTPQITIGSDGNWYVDGVDTGKPAQGDKGVGVASVVQTKTSDENGGVNEVTVTLTDGTSAVLSVKNGTSAVVDDLETDDADKALSAAQGVALNEKVSALELSAKGGDLDLSGYEALKGHLGSGTAWGTSSNSRHIYIPCEPGDMFTLTAGDTACNYAFMPDAPAWVSGGAVTTLGGRVSLAAGATAVAECPDGAAYLYIQTLTSGKVSCAPESVSVSGLSGKVDALRAGMSGISGRLGALELFDGGILNIQYSVLANVTGYAGNTMGHFLHGVSKGFNALKADMRLTSDGGIILCHDAGFTLNGDGRITSYDSGSAGTTAIHDMTLAQCRALEFASADAEGNRYSPVELSEFIYLCKCQGIIPFITLRHDSWISETAAAMVAALKKHGMESRAIINLYVSPAQLKEMAAVLDEVAPRVRRCYTMLEGWAMSLSNLQTGIACGCQYICTFSSHQGDITDDLCVFMADNNARLLSIIHSEEEYHSTTRAGYAGFQSYADYAPVKIPAALSMAVAV